MLQQPSADLFCRLLEETLKNEEKEIRSIGVDRQPVEHFLLSVAFARELSIQYLIRKTALRLGVPLEGEVPCIGGSVDFCTVHNGKYSASLEVKGWVFDRWDPDRLRADIDKHFDPATTIQNADPSAKRYNAWIVIEQVPKPEDALRECVKKVLGGRGTLDEFKASDPIPINRVNNAAYVDSWRYRYENLRVVVFNATLDRSAAW